MADESVRATAVINAPAQAIFAVLADPATHASIDGTGWVCENVNSKPSRLCVEAKSRTVRVIASGATVDAAGNSERG